MPALNDSIAKIREYGSRRGYGHDMVRYGENSNYEDCAAAAEFDAIIDGLHAFEDIRYPETLIREGATISIGILRRMALRSAILTVTGLGNRYVLQLPQIDRLMELLLAHPERPPAFLPRITDDARAMIYYTWSARRFWVGPRNPCSPQLKRPRRGCSHEQNHAPRAHRCRRVFVGRGSNCSERPFARPGNAGRRPCRGDRSRLEHERLILAECGVEAMAATAETLKRFALAARP